MIDCGIWGVLEVDSSEQRDFSVDTEDFLLTAGSIVGMALRRHQVSEAHHHSLGQLAAANNKLDVLLNEMHHRVKNNFQGILSIITFERRNAHGQAGAALSKLAESIVAMGLAHDQLAISQSGTVDLANYLRTLVTRIKKPIATVTVDVKADAFDAPVDQAVALGLIVNELVTNSSKHAFDETGGTVWVELSHGSEYGTVRLTVSDNGKGADFSKSGGSGLKLIDALARQLRGRTERESSPQGTRTSVVFPLS
jgi:two-component sensor histidine kinase